jgi:phage repressor protein C with HTH and peptisase S24 domain
VSRKKHSIREITREILSSLNLKKAELARELGLNPASISDLLSGKAKSFSGPVMEILTHKYGINKEWLQGKSNKMYTGPFIPYYKKSSIAQIVYPSTPIKLKPGHFQLGAPSKEYISLPDIFSRDNNYFVVIIQGESLYQKQIIHGDYLIVEDTDIKNNELGCIRVNKEIIYGRVYYKENDKIIELLPENPQYPLRSFQKNEVQIIGKIVGVFRKL